MDRKIIVAGGGHGGIAAAALLAENGFKVTVFERNAEENMGYDWTDIFDKRAFEACGMPMPPKDKYILKNNMTFFPPSMTKPITQETEQGKFEIQMERKDIYRHIIAQAKDKGVEFRFETAILAPVFKGGRVVGIKTDKGDYYADLIIDACGASSPIRQQMPYFSGIQKSVNRYECFYVYRGFFERTAEIPENNFRVLLMNRGNLGISWVAAEEEHTDVLIGRFEPLTTEFVEEELASLRQTQPQLGEKLLRGGQFVTIPVRQPLGVLVANGYAAIGDSAFMTVPLIGSGIANSMKAAAILADTVSRDINREFTAASLWNYQTEFYRKLGAGLAPIAAIKLLLTKVTPDDIDYLFEHEILKGREVTMDCDSNSILAFASKIMISTLPYKAKELIKRPALLIQLALMAKRITEAVAVCLAVPLKYDRGKVLKWVTAYNRVFET